MCSRRSSGERPGVHRGLHTDVRGEQTGQGGQRPVPADAVRSPVPCRRRQPGTRVGGYAVAPNNVSIIGCDAANGTYVQLYSDERGVCRVYEMSMGNGSWRLWREGEPFSERFTARFSDDGNTITGHWEIAEDGSNYTTDFDLMFRRVDT